MNGLYNIEDTMLFLMDCYDMVINVQSFTLMENWSDHQCKLLNNFDNEKKLFETLMLLLQTIKSIRHAIKITNINIILTKKIWECECFRKIIHKNIETGQR